MAGRDSLSTDANSLHSNNSASPRYTMMLVFSILLVLYTILGCLYWLLQCVGTILTIKHVRSLEDLPVEKQKKWPRVSVIIPACNEEKWINQAVQTRLKLDYPNLEVVLINDRSTDRTGAIIDQIANEDSRVKVLHIAEVPLGWLGKVYAQQRGAEIATGEWLLFSDADVFLKPAVLKQVIAYAQSKKLDHVAALPQLYPTTFFVDICLSIFVRHMCVFGEVWRVEDEQSSVGVGAGAFNCVHRTAFDRVEGFKRIKLFVADDVGLGRILKLTGSCSSLLNGRNSVGVYFYHSVREMAIGSERALFTFLGGFSCVRLVVMALVIVAIETAPFMLLIPWGLPYIPAVGAVLVALTLFVSITLNRWTRRPFYTAFFIPIAICIMAACIVRAGILGTKRGGIVWRGTFYPTEVLKSGATIT